MFLARLDNELPITMGFANFSGYNYEPQLISYISSSLLVASLYHTNEGRKENLAECEVELTAAPNVDDGTHWGPGVLLHPPVHVNERDEVDVTFSLSRSEEDYRLMNVDLGYKIKLLSGEMLASVINKFYME